MVRVYDRNCRLQRQIKLGSGVRVKAVDHLADLQQYVITTSTPSLLFIDDSVGTSDDVASLVRASVRKASEAVEAARSPRLSNVNSTSVAPTLNAPYVCADCCVDGSGQQALLDCDALGAQNGHVWFRSCLLPRVTLLQARSGR